jgi:hypothetical protein
MKSEVKKRVSIPMEAGFLTSPDDHRTLVAYNKRAPSITGNACLPARFYGNRGGSVMLTRKERSGIIEIGQTPRISDGKRRTEYERRSILWMQQDAIWLKRGFCHGYVI